MREYAHVSKKMLSKKTLARKTLIVLRVALVRFFVEKIKG